MEEEKSLLREAEAAVDELTFAVKKIDISKKLENSHLRIYLNLTTCEGKNYCIELTERGWRVVSEVCDQLGDQSDDHCYETMYQLLDTLSPEYRRKFGQKIAVELEKHLQQENLHN